MCIHFICFGALLWWLRWKIQLHLLGIWVLKLLASASVLAFQWVIQREREKNKCWWPNPDDQTCPCDSPSYLHYFNLNRISLSQCCWHREIAQPWEARQARGATVKKSPSPIAHYGVPYFPVLCIPHRQEEIMSRPCTFDLSLWSNLKWPNGLPIFQRPPCTVLCHTCRDSEN